MGLFIEQLKDEKSIKKMASNRKESFKLIGQGIYDPFQKR